MRHLHGTTKPRRFTIEVFVPCELKLAQLFNLSCRSLIFQRWRSTYNNKLNVAILTRVVAVGWTPVDVNCCTDAAGHYFVLWHRNMKELTQHLVLWLSNDLDLFLNLPLCVRHCLDHPTSHYSVCLYCKRCTLLLLCCFFPLYFVQYLPCWTSARKISSLTARHMDTDL